MIKSISPILTTTLLLTGSFIVLTIPVWMTYVLLASMATILTAHLAFKHIGVLPLIGHFCAEFIGFCILVTLFVGSLVMMNVLLAG